MNKEYKSIDELKERAQQGLKIPFGEMDKNGRIHLLKGGVGQMVEESLFEYKPNSDSSPDFDNLGVELKTTPFVTDEKKHTRKAKERLVLNIINYMTENLDSFEQSHFWYKNHTILMMFYEYHKSIPREDWYIDKFILFDWPDEDLSIVKNDWGIIAGKIKDGKAHELSESDTMYLAACTKGSTAEKSYRKQPYSDIPAKQRAYSLKPAYMTYLLNHYVYGEAENEKIIKSADCLVSKSFETVIQDMVAPYIGKTQKELVELFDIKPSKATNYSIINKILKLNGDIKNTQEFQKANIMPKTIRIEPDGNIKESMSFATFKFKELINEEWEESDFYHFVAESRFMFIIFQKINQNEEDSYFKGIQFWAMPDQDIEEAKKCWLETVSKIKEGVVIAPSSKGFKNNLPSSIENRVAHVRPHAAKAYYKLPDYEDGNPKDGNELPDGRWMTTQCFWLNRSYVKSIVINNNLSSLSRNKKNKKQ